MALLFIEGFETYGDLSGAFLEGRLEYKWGNADMTGVSSDGSIQTGRDGGKSLKLADYNDVRFRAEEEVDETDFIVGFAVKTNASAPYGLFNVSRLAGGSHLHLTTTDGTDLRVHLLGSGTPDTTASSVLTQDVWYYIEVKLHIDNTTGSYEVKVDGVTKLSNSGVDTFNSTGNPGIDINFYNETGSGGATFDDIYICDNTGAQNNDFLGDCSVVAIDPISDVTTEWGSTGAAHYTEIDDDYLSSTDYIETGSPTAVDLFGFQNVTSLFGAIYGIQVCCATRDSDDPVDLRIVSGATTSDAVGTDTGPYYSPSYITYTRIVELDPNTSSAWTLSNLNTAQFGAILGS